MFCMQDENVEDTSNGSNDRQIGIARVRCSVFRLGCYLPPPFDSISFTKLSLEGRREDATGRVKRVVLTRDTIAGDEGYRGQ